MNPPLYDSHNHLHDDQLRPHREAIFMALKNEGVARVVVNGTHERDWPEVLALALAHPSVIPSFGLHPWQVPQRSPDWQRNLLEHLEQIPSAIGEIGLDRWKADLDPRTQEEAFLWQWRLAAARHLPASVHCLRAWGRLLELLSAEPRPRRGFLLHSYGGPAEMVRPLARLGAYFSISGYFAHERQARRRETFRQVPADRLLIETDAPDMAPPRQSAPYPLTDTSSGEPINHPANLIFIYRFTAELMGESVEGLAARVRANFQQLFGETGRGLD